MRRWFGRLLLLGLAALPARAQAQYPAPGYYYARPVPAYGPAYPYGYPAMPTGYAQPYAPPAASAQPASTYSPATAPSSAPYPASLPPVTSAPTLRPAPAVTSAPPVRHLADLPLRAPEAPPADLRLTGSPTPSTAEPAAPRQAEVELIAAPREEVPDATPKATTPAVIALPGDVLKYGKHAVAVEEPAVAACPADCKDCKHPCVLAFGEYLYWTVHGVDLPFAQAFDGTDPFTSVPRGAVGIASPRFESGFRAGLGVALGEDSWVVGTFTWFRDTTSAGLSAPGGFVLHNNLVFPNTVNSAGDSFTANADYNIEMLTADVDYKCAIVHTDHVLLNWLAGARYGHLDQKLLATYEITGTTTVDAHVNFDGGGPRAGLEGEYRVLGGFFGYGKGVANLLAGQFSGSYEERNVFTGLVGQTSVREDRLVPILELEVGGGWQSHKGHVRVSAGYYVGGWFNALTMPTLAGGIQHNDFTTNGNNFRDTITFDGLVGRIEFRY